MWAGWHAGTAAPVQLEDDWQPWSVCCDEADAPVVRWFHGGLMNAAFNEVDRHVLQQPADATSFVCDSSGAPDERIGLRWFGPWLIDDHNRRRMYLARTHQFRAAGYVVGFQTNRRREAMGNAIEQVGLQETTHHAIIPANA